MTSTPAVTETRAEWAMRVTLRDYREQRRHGDPYQASLLVLDADARCLADHIAEGVTDERDIARYRASRALHEAVRERADVGGSRKFHELSRTEQYWSTGKLAQPLAVTA